MNIHDAVITITKMTTCILTNSATIYKLTVPVQSLDKKRGRR